MPDRALAAICACEGLDPAGALPLAGGQSNSVYLLEGRHVLRMGCGEEARRRLEGEAALLARLPAEVPAPRVTAAGRLDDWTYQLQPRLDGQPLHHLWPSLSPRVKDGLVAQAVAALRAVHALSAEGFGPPSDPAQRDASWRERCTREFAALLAQVPEVGYALPPAMTGALERFLSIHAEALEPATPCLVHGDLWPGNLLVDGERLAAILDWELATLAPRDYELLLIEHFCLYPNDFAEEDREVYCAADFADYAALFAAHYPEMLAAPRLRERLDLYQLGYILDVHVSWAREYGVGGGGPLSLLAKGANFLSAHGARMFQPDLAGRSAADWYRAYAQP